MPTTARSNNGQPDRPAFIHSKLDDYGLSPSNFRVYCHIVRRANNGVAWPSISSAARVCRLHPQTVRKALAELTRRVFLTRHPRLGATTQYRLTKPSEWVSVGRTDCDPSRADAAPLSSEASPTNSINHSPYESDICKGNPLKENPSKAIHTLSSLAKRKCVKDHQSIVLLAELIYEAYPKKVGKPQAICAIRRALAKHPFDFLLERTRQFASACTGDPRYIPYPARWFAEERFNDDPATWPHATGPKSKSAPAIIHSDHYRSDVGKL
jgi:Helix-turn-helix domain